MCGVLWVLMEFQCAGLSAGDEYDTCTWNCLSGGVMFAEGEVKNNSVRVLGPGE